MGRKSILVISPELWGEYFLSKHYYAHYLSKSNDVYFLNPVNMRWSVREFVSPTIRVESITPTLSVISYANVLPKLGMMGWPLQSILFRLMAQRIQKRIGVPKLDVVWSFDFTRFNDQTVWNSTCRILHFVELPDHPHFSHSGRFRGISIRSSDLIVSIADVITSQVNPLKPRKLFQINHGADIDGFTGSSDKTIKLPGNNKIKACFVGNFQYSFDFKLLESLAIRFSQVDFVIIAPLSSSSLGSQAEVVKDGIEKLRRIVNVHLVGGIPSAELMTYLRNVDINLILYQDRNASGHANPHKLMSYFYAGKVIISSFVHQYRDRSDLIVMAKQNEELPVLFSDVLANLSFHNADDQQNLRRNFALENSYEKQIQKIFSELNSL